MLNSYDSIAENWQATRTGFASKKYVDLLLSKLNPGDQVLDLGCGTGTPIGQHLIQSGFRVVGVDQSARMLEIAREVIPEAELIQADMCEVDLPQGFAAAIAWDSIFHIERASSPGDLSEIVRCASAWRMVVVICRRLCG